MQVALQSYSLQHLVRSLEAISTFRLPCPGQDHRHQRLLHRLDMTHEPWTQMKRVSIETFTGDKRRYEEWKASFIACVDSSPATPEYKFLQMK